MLYSYPVDEAPTGLLLHEDKVYITTFGSTGHLQVMQKETGKVEKIIPTGSGACSPLLGPDGKRIYVCNQFSNNVVEIDLANGKYYVRLKFFVSPDRQYLVKMVNICLLPISCRHNEPISIM